MGSKVQSSETPPVIILGEDNSTAITGQPKSLISTIEALSSPFPTKAVTATKSLRFSPDPTLSTELSDTASPAQTLTPLPKPGGKRTKYWLEAVLDMERHRLDVKESIKFLNSTENQLSVLVLVVDAQRYPGVFKLKAVYDAFGNKLSQYQLKGTALTIRLPQEVAPGNISQFSIEYSLQLLDVSKLPKTRPYPLGYTNIQTNFGDWYPFIPPYDTDKGWLVHPPTVYGENLVYDTADIDVAIRVEGGGAGLVFAAGTPAQIEGEWKRYQLERSRGFAWSVSPYYQVVTETIKLTDGTQTLISSYYFAPFAEAGKDLLKAMKQALQVYANIFDVSTPSALAGVQVDFMDGMEYDGLFFLSTDFYNWHKSGEEDFLYALAAHETAHQWWYALVGNDQAMEPWLDEALCTYSEQIYYETLHPELLTWWWDYRVNYYEPNGWVNMTIYDAPQVVGQYRAYRDPVYLQGSIFLNELREMIGDQAFFSGLREYIKGSAFGIGNGELFWEAMKKQSGIDLSEIYRKYFQGEYK